MCGTADNVKQVSKCTYSVTIITHSPGFDFCQMKYWKETAHSLVTTEKENNSNVNVLIVATSALTIKMMLSSCHCVGSWAVTSWRNNFRHPPTSQV
jgi:hypothetical protein